MNMKWMNTLTVLMKSEGSCTVSLLWEKILNHTECMLWGCRANTRWLMNITYVTLQKHQRSPSILSGGFGTDSNLKEGGFSRLILNSFNSQRDNFQALENGVYRVTDDGELADCQA